MGLDLTAEKICEDKWKPWFDAGGWEVQHFTSPESAEFRIPDVLNRIKPYATSEGIKIIESILKSYAKTLNFPHDGEAVRGQFIFCFDYKYKINTRLGIWIAKVDYDKYWSWHKPWFYLLIWCKDRQKRYLHQLHDPSKYKIEIPWNSEKEHYDITEDCIEPAEPEVPITVPNPISYIDSIAWTIAINRWAKSGRVGKIAITAEDLSQAKALANMPRPFLVMLREAARRV